MKYVSLQYQRGIIVEKLNRNFLFLWGVVVLTTMLYLLPFYNSYRNVRSELQEQSQALFQSVVKDDTDRRIKELGDTFCFEYAGADRLERDSITIITADTIIHMKNNKEAARRMSSQEKTDFCLQLLLSMENPIQVALLNNAFRDSLHKWAIPAQTVTCYTFVDQTECSSKDTSFYRSYTPLKEIVFGVNRTIVLQAFVQIPFHYILGKAFLRNILWIIVILILWVIAVVLIRWRLRIHVLPLQEAPKEIIQITEDILFDETHGVLYYHEHRIELANQRLKLFGVLLRHNGNFVESNRLKEEIWPDGCVTKDALTATAKRLKEDLSPIPGLTIESARGRGYMLNASPLENNQK